MVHCVYIYCTVTSCSVRCHARSSHWLVSLLIILIMQLSRWNAEISITLQYLIQIKVEHLYSALHGIQTTLKRSGMDHTDLPAINTIPALTS